MLRSKSTSFSTRLMRHGGVVTAALIAFHCTPPEDDIPDPPDPPQGWVFETLDSSTEQNLMDTWLRSDGVTFAVGFGGVVVNNDLHPFASVLRIIGYEEGDFWTGPTPSKADLRGLAGVENGGRYGLATADGEMVAVGHDGTILHFHPNPDGDPTSRDGTWRLISGLHNDQSRRGELRAYIRPDPACPDFDGDGVGDDGDGSNWVGDALCRGGASTGCDDNCLRTPNGGERPLLDLDLDGCLGPADGPSSDMSTHQADADEDGVGTSCDDDDTLVDELPVFSLDLFDVAMMIQGEGEVEVQIVGENGVRLSYSGADGASGDAILDGANWEVEKEIPFRFSNEASSGLLAPACPAKCHPARTSCSCDVSMGQCCDAAASTGAGCGDGSCGPSANACDAASGICSNACPDCVRRTVETLRTLTSSGGTWLSAGARGRIVFRDTAPGDASVPWTAPTCIAPPAPLDEFPVLTAAVARAGQFLLVGSGGAIFRVSTASDCAIESFTGAPAAFLSGLVSLSDDRFIVVGDQGTLIDLRVSGANPVDVIDTPTNKNLFSVAADRDPDGRRRLRLFGADGALLEGVFFP